MDVSIKTSGRMAKGLRAFCGSEPQGETAASVLLANLVKDCRLCIGSALFLI
jgi:hypothetical protein